MIIYHYDEFGAFVGASNARPNPEEKDEALIPNQATEIAPPAAGAQEVPVFDPAAETWSVQEDNRGAVFDTQTEREERWVEPGPLPDHIAESLPPSGFHEWDPATRTWVLNEAARLAKARRDKIDEIKQLGLSRIQARIGAVDSFAMVELLRILWPVLVDPASQPTLAASKDIFLYAKQKIEEIRLADLTTVEAYDPAADPDFPT